LWAYEKDNAIDKLESMLQHETLHLTVVDATPVGSGQEGPANLDLASLLVVTMEARRSNHVSSVGVDCDQSTTGRQGLTKVCAEGPFFMSILVRMLLPNEPIGSDCVEVIVIL
jgi:hypothetical protein